MRKTHQDFTSQLYRAMPAYRDLDKWFAKNLDDQFGLYYRRAWTVYKNVLRNQLGFILLGDTRIRMRQQNILQFGILSATNNPQDQTVQALVAAAQGQRTALGQLTPHEQRTLTPTQQNAKTAIRRPVPVTQVGSILSSEGWSPIMNDALIVAGVDNGTDFVYTLVDDEKWAFERICKRHYKRDPLDAERYAADPNSPATWFIHQRPPANNTEAAKVQWNREREQSSRGLWQIFFNEKSKVLWRKGIPRVFARELLGLHFFGYRPSFDHTQITFSQVSQPASTTFSDYLERLREVGYGAPYKRGIGRVVSEFLFNDRDALKVNKWN